VKVFVEQVPVADTVAEHMDSQSVQEERYSQLESQPHPPQLEFQSSPTLPPPSTQYNSTPSKVYISIPSQEVKPLVFHFIHGVLS
jgi:sortase (surface protein transpeptidase)